MDLLDFKKNPEILLIGVALIFLLFFTNQKEEECA